MEGFIKHFILFLIGGFSYYMIEMIWRGRSHMTMFVLGGLCFIIIGLVSQHRLINGRNMILQLLIYSSIITLLELIFGLVFNIKLGLGIWDYSDLRFNFMGQISLVFSIIWFFLSLPLIFFYKYLGNILF